MKYNNIYNMKNLVDFILEKFQEFNEGKYYLGTLIYSIEDKTIDADSYEENDTESDSEDDIMDLIKHWVKYPDNSYYNDLRNANDRIPVFYVFTSNEDEDEIIVNDKFYLAKSDKNFVSDIKKAIDSEKWDLVFDTKNYNIELV